MIPIQEVRYGNLGQVSGMVYEYSIGPNGDPHPFFWRRHEDGFFECASLDKIEPIPITPEWLERLGAAKDGYDGGLYFIITPEYDYPGDYIEFHFTPGMRLEMWAGKDTDGLIIDYVRYVHQLQNLYHSLTGQELTVKQPETT